MLYLVAAAKPARPDDLSIARLLARFEEPEALERLFLTSQWRALDSVPAFAELAQLLGFAGLYDLAFECLAHAHALDPLAADVHYLRGLFEMFSGRMAASQASIRRAIELEPRMASAPLAAVDAGKGGNRRPARGTETIPMAYPVLSGVKKAYIQDTNMEFLKISSITTVVSEVIPDLDAVGDDEIIKLSVCDMQNAERNAYSYLEKF